MKSMDDIIQDMKKEEKEQEFEVFKSGTSATPEQLIKECESIHHKQLSFDPNFKDYIKNISKKF